MNLDRKILERIEKEGLTIRPRWFFMAKDFAFGAGSLVSIILGSISLGLFLEVMALQGKDLTWSSVPYFFPVLMIIFLIAGYWAIGRTGYFYKARFMAIFSAFFFLNLASGYLAYASGMAMKIESELEKIPGYVRIVPVVRESPAYPTNDSDDSSQEERQKEEEAETKAYQSHIQKDADGKDGYGHELELKRENGIAESNSSGGKQDEDEKYGSAGSHEEAAIKGVGKEAGEKKVEEGDISQKEGVSEVKGSKATRP